MKKTILATIVCVTITLLQLACGPSNTERAKKGHARDSDNSCPLSQTGGFTISDSVRHEDLTPLDTARADVKRLDSLLMSVFGRDSVPLRAFNLNTHDIMFAHGIRVDSSLKRFHARAYFGIEKDLKTFKLYILPILDTVQSNNPRLSRISPKNPGHDTVVTFISSKPPHAKTYCALELNTPCPNTCDLKSPLYIHHPN